MSSVHQTYEWDVALDDLRETDLLRDQGESPRDWFTKENLSYFIQVFDDAQEVNKAVYRVEQSRRDIEDSVLSRQLLEWEVDEVKVQLETIKTSLQEIFNILTKLCDTALDNVVTWAGSTGKASDLDDISRQYKPTKKQQFQRLRLEAKRWTLIRTYIDPLTKKWSTSRAVAQSGEFSKKLRQTEEVIHSFLKWLWVCYRDLIEHAQISNPSKRDIVLRELKYRVRHPKEDDEVDIPTLRKIVNREFNIGIGLRELFDLLEELNDDEQAYSVRVWSEGEEPELGRDERYLPMIEDDRKSVTVSLSYEQEYDSRHIRRVRNYNV